ncbi:MAG: flagellar hook capping protein [Planctomycetaceae bacterium]|jgi:flagellar basal-body rod modification protein FlgD|nr:flagellar hook capping protein [Planctomycetaceae bacterium]
MSEVDNTLLNSSASTVTQTTTVSSDRMNDLTTSDFIKMMVAELQNQDPMEPMSNTEMLSQISQMRQITSNDKLSTAIESMMRSEALSTASSLIGKTITGVDSLGENVTGQVDKVTIENGGAAKLHVGNSIVEVTSVTAISQ